MHYSLEAHNYAARCCLQHVTGHRSGHALLLEHCSRESTFRKIPRAFRTGSHHGNHQQPSPHMAQWSPLRTLMSCDSRLTAGQSPMAPHRRTAPSKRRLLTISPSSRRCETAMAAASGAFTRASVCRTVKLNFDLGEFKALLQSPVGALVSNVGHEI